MARPIFWSGTMKASSAPAVPLATTEQKERYAFDPTEAEGLTTRFEVGTRKELIYGFWLVMRKKCETVAALDPESVREATTGKLVIPLLSDDTAFDPDGPAVLPFRWVWRYLNGLDQEILPPTLQAMERVLHYASYLGVEYHDVSFYDRWIEHLREIDLDVDREYSLLLRVLEGINNAIVAMKRKYHWDRNYSHYAETWGQEAGKLVEIIEHGYRDRYLGPRNPLIPIAAIERINNQEERKVGDLVELTPLEASGDVTIGRIADLSRIVAFNAPQILVIESSKGILHLEQAREHSRTRKVLPFAHWLLPAARPATIGDTSLLSEARELLAEGKRVILEATHLFSHNLPFAAVSEADLQKDLSRWGNKAAGSKALNIYGPNLTVVIAAIIASGGASRLPEFQEEIIATTVELRKSFKPEDPAWNPPGAGFAIAGGAGPAAPPAFAFGGVPAGIVGMAGPPPPPPPPAFAWGAAGGVGGGAVGPVGIPVPGGGWWPAGAAPAGRLPPPAPPVMDEAGKIRAQWDRLITSAEPEVAGILSHLGTLYRVRIYRIPG